jgi:hypothetical protein
MMTPMFVDELEEFEAGLGAVDETTDVAVAVEWAVSTMVLPDCVIVNVGGRPVAKGPSVACPAAGVVAVAEPDAPPPITV